jgi:hypothetical protein
MSLRNDQYEPDETDVPSRSFDEIFAEIQASIDEIISILGRQAAGRG